MRVRVGKARIRKKKRLFKAVKGNRGGRGKLLRTVKETLVRARAFSFRDRKTKKREYRALWITRVSAACRERGLRYSLFMRGLSLAGIGLNRKMLSELAISEPAIFDEIFAAAKNALAAQAN